MSKWVGKYVIGLTGNIGTGKSVVRKMLEYLGAYGIDADALAHRAIMKGAPGYISVLENFGRWVLNSNGQIDRTRLGRLVFSEHEAMELLEKIIHPLVDQAIDILIQRTTHTHKVVVIEAIKLLESNIHKHCDSIWVVYVAPEIQLKRLIQARRMTEAEARRRIDSQTSQAEKISVAQVVIKNEGTYKDTWDQVTVAWENLFPTITTDSAKLKGEEKIPKRGLTVVRAKPQDSNKIAEFMNRMRGSCKRLEEEDIMAAFGEKAFVLINDGRELCGLIGWQVENLIARTVDIVINPAFSLGTVLSALVMEMEKISKDLQCEAALIHVPHKMAKMDTLWQHLGYEMRTPHSLGVSAWQEAAEESIPGTSLYFKQLRQDRVLRPL